MKVAHSPEPLSSKVAYVAIAFFVDLRAPLRGRCLPDELVRAERLNQAARSSPTGNSGLGFT